MRTLLGLRDHVEGDGDGAGGEIGAGLPIPVRGEEDGIHEGELERLALADSFAEFVTGAGGDASEGVLHAGRKMSDVIVNKDAVGVSLTEDLALCVGMRRERSGMGIDQRAQDAGGGGFARSFGSIEDEDGIGAAGLERRKKPGLDFGGAFGAETEEAGERVEGWSGGGWIGGFGRGRGWAPGARRK